MHSSTLTRITIGTLGVLLTGTTGLAVHQVDQASAWLKEAAGWQAAALQTNQTTAQLSTQNKKLVHKYNKLVKTVGATTTAATPITVAASAPAATAAPVQAAPAAAPTAKAS